MGARRNWAARKSKGVERTPGNHGHPEGKQLKQNSQDLQYSRELVVNALSTVIFFVYEEKGKKYISNSNYYLERKLPGSKPEPPCLSDKNAIFKSANICILYNTHTHIFHAQHSHITIFIKPFIQRNARVQCFELPR